jgi:hypothetical protein
MANGALFRMALSVSMTVSIYGAFKALYHAQYQPWKEYRPNATKCAGDHSG